MIEISPQNPTSTDNVSVTVTGTSDCGDATELTDNSPIFTFTVDFSCGGGFLPHDHTFTFQIGNLSSGDYTIIYNSGIQGVLLSEQQSFTIVDAVSPVNVPSLNPLGLIMLSVALLFAGKHYFKSWDS